MYICFSLIVIASVVVIAGQQNKIDSFESRHSFGIVYPGEVLTHSFKLTNNYKKKLKLVDIKSSCGCTIISIGKKTLLPGESTLLKMEFNTREYMGSREVHVFLTGKIRNKKKLIYNFILDATIEKVVEFSRESHYLNLGEFELQYAPKNKTFFITRGSHPLEWDSMKCKPFEDNIKCTVSKVGPDKWKLNIQLNNENELGTIFNDLEFSFWKNGKKCDYKLIKPVMAKIIGPIISSPRSLLVGVVATNESVTKIINLKSRGAAIDKPFEILSVDCSDSEWVKADIIEMDSKPAVKVVFSPKEEYGAKFGEIIVTVKVDPVKVYKLRIDYLVRVISRENL